ncbi:MAG TPA: histidine phosphatase family protein [Cyclobacteriaceae bacterium]
MSSKKIYVIRHGQTDFNRMSIVQGSGIDTSLNDLGRKQANAFYRKYAHIPFDRVYTSALRRTIETVDDFIRKGIAHESLAELNEISWGTREGRQITPESDAYYRYLLDEWSKGNTALAIDGGESPDQVLSRISGALERILSNHQDRRILMCIHGRAIRILLCHMFRRPLRVMDEYKHTNLGLYLVHYNGDGFTLEMENDIGHLGEEGVQ